jgi:hypothetical protein
MAKDSQIQGGGGSGRPEAKFIVEIGEIVRHARSGEYHEGAVVLRQSEENRFLDKLISAIPYYTGGQEEAVNAMSACLAREACFYCSAQVARCAFCNGQGVVRQSGTTCRACNGTGITACNFCADTGLASIETVPNVFRRNVIQKRIGYAGTCMKRALEVYEKTRPPVAKTYNQVRKHAQSSIGLARKSQAIIEEALARVIKPSSSMVKIRDDAESLISRATRKIETLGKRKRNSG